MHWCFSNKKAWAGGTVGRYPAVEPGFLWGKKAAGTTCLDVMAGKFMVPG